MKYSFCIKTIVSYILIILIYSNVNAQSKGLKLATTTIDFGRIAASKYPPKTVEFTNTSNKRLAILIVDKTPDVKVGFQHKFFEPGEKGLISFYYDVNDMGNFNKQVKIYTNLSDNPTVVTLKGTCVAVEACFPNKSDLNLRYITIINKETQEPIPQASVTFVHNFTEKPVTYKMNKKGQAVKKMPIGHYNARSDETGFEKYNTDFFLRRSQPNVIIELTPVKTPVQPLIAETPVKKNADKPDTIVPEIKPVITSTELPENKYAANNIVLLLDVSSSMRNNSKFALLQQSINNLVMILRSIDNVSIITYAGEANIVLEGIPGNEKDRIMDTVQNLKPYGITHGVKGLNTAYSLASKKYIKGGNNQVILATDGEFSEKTITDEYYKKFISDNAARRIKLSILGFGINDEAIARMKKMTAAGDGTYIQVSMEKLTKDVLINEIKSKSFIGE